MEIAKWLVGALTCASLALPLQAQETTTKGEITKVDRPGGRLTIKHGEIKNLDMPPMTMSFQVREATMLDGVAVGDRVRFTAERIEGRYTVVTLHKAR